MKTQVVRRKGDLTLVEWTDEAGLLRRNWVPPYLIVRQQDGYAEVTTPEVGLHYGIDFGELVTLRATKSDVDRALKQKGIWTAEDLRARPNEALAALRDVYGIDLAALLNAVAEYEQQSL